MILFVKMRGGDMKVIGLGWAIVLVLSAALNFLHYNHIAMNLYFLRFPSK